MQDNTFNRDETDIRTCIYCGSRLLDGENEICSACEQQQLESFLDKDK